MPKKVSSQVLVSILNFLKPFTTKSILADIKTLFQPCCKPTLIGSEEYSCCDGIATCARVTVVDENLAGKTVTLLFEFTGNINDNHTFSITAEFDSTGTWADDVRIWGYVEDEEVVIRVGVIKEGSKIMNCIKCGACTCTGIRLVNGLCAKCRAKFKAFLKGLF